MLLTKRENLDWMEKLAGVAGWLAGGWSASCMNRRCWLAGWLGAWYSWLAGWLRGWLVVCSGLTSICHIDPQQCLLAPLSTP